MVGDLICRPRLKIVLIMLLFLCSCFVDCGPKACLNDCRLKQHAAQILWTYLLLIVFLTTLVRKLASNLLLDGEMTRIMNLHIYIAKYLYVHVPIHLYVYTQRETETGR